MNRNRTDIALMARGMTSTQAMQLREQRWTLGKLQLSNDAALRSLGISAEVIERLRGDARPAIPADTLTNVLFANRWVCCICRDAGRPVIVHHIRLWAESRDHSNENLAVLCTQHHGEAHTTRGLEVTFTPTRLRDAKRVWEAEAARLDAVAIQQGTQLQSDNWLYFNHLRLLELAVSNGVDLNEVQGYGAALRAKVCDEDGNIIKAAEPGSFMYVDSDRMPLYRYMRNVLYTLLAHATVRNISDDLDRGVLKTLVMEGDLIYVQGLHVFSNMQPAPGNAQPVNGVRSANKVEIAFVFDRREATSTSAWADWLRGSHAVGSLLQVKRLERNGDRLRVSGTVIAIRTALEGLKERTYEVGLYKSGLIGDCHSIDEDDDLLC
jgi:hypothetical protein